MRLLEQLQTEFRLGPALKNAVTLQPEKPRRRQRQRRFCQIGLGACGKAQTFLPMVGGGSICEECFLARRWSLVKTDCCGHVRGIQDEIKVCKMARHTICHQCPDGVKRQVASCPECQGRMPSLETMARARLRKDFYLSRPQARDDILFDLPGSLPRQKKENHLP